MLNPLVCSNRMKKPVMHCHSAAPAFTSKLHSVKLTRGNIQLRTPSSSMAAPTALKWSLYTNEPLSKKSLCVWKDRANTQIPKLDSSSLVQTISVDRSSSESRYAAAGAVKRKAMDNIWPRVLLFPEGEGQT